MIREAKWTRKLIIYENSECYLRNVNPKKVQLQVISNNVIKFGKKIIIKNNDTVILTAISKDRELFISISKYLGFEIFEEQYFEIITSEELDKITKYNLTEDFPYGDTAYNLLMNNIAVLTTASAQARKPVAKICSWFFIYITIDFC